MNPRLSAPTTRSMFLPRNGLAISSTDRANPDGSASSGVMSRNKMPGLGKSGMSRISFVRYPTGLFMPASVRHHARRRQTAADSAGLLSLRKFPAECPGYQLRSGQSQALGESIGAIEQSALHRDVNPLRALSDARPASLCGPAVKSLLSN